MCPCRPAVFAHVFRRQALPALLLAAGSGFAAAGTVQADTSIGVNGLASLGTATVNGQQTIDGVLTPLPPLTTLGASLSVSGVAGAGAQQSISVPVVPAPGAEPLNLPGSATARADLPAGTLGLAVSTAWVPVVSASGSELSAFTVGYAGVQMAETFDVRVPLDLAASGPLSVTLRMQLSGTVLDLANDAELGLRSTLKLNNVLPVGTSGGPLGVTRQDEFTSSVAATTLVIRGVLQDGACSVTLGVCGYVFGAYGALETFGRYGLAGYSFVGVAGGDGLDFLDGARLSLELPAGATVTTLDGQAAPAWVGVVPEPAPLSLWLVAGGLASLARVRRMKKGRA